MMPFSEISLLPFARFQHQFAHIHLAHVCKRQRVVANAVGIYRAVVLAETTPLELRGAFNYPCLNGVLVYVSQRNEKVAHVVHDSAVQTFGKQWVLTFVAIVVIVDVCFTYALHRVRHLFSALG